MPLSSDRGRAVIARLRALGVHEEDLEETFVRSGGKGGQNVNKVPRLLVLAPSPHGRRGVEMPAARSHGQNRLLAPRSSPTRSRCRACWGRASAPGPRGRPRSATETATLTSRQAEILTAKHARSEIKAGRTRVPARAGLVPPHPAGKPGPRSSLTERHWAQRRYRGVRPDCVRRPNRRRTGACLRRTRGVCFPSTISKVRGDAAGRGGPSRRQEPRFGRRGPAPVDGGAQTLPPGARRRNPLVAAGAAVPHVRGGRGLVGAFFADNRDRIGGP